jgi:hypothetical protein
MLAIKQKSACTYSKSYVPYMCTVYRLVCKTVAIKQKSAGREIFAEKPRKYADLQYWTTWASVASFRFIMLFGDDFVGDLAKRLQMEKFDSTFTLRRLGDLNDY